MTIGYTNGLKVIWNKQDETVRVQGTSILIVGAKTILEAIELAKRNLVNFK